MLSVQQPNGTYFDLKYGDDDVIVYAQMQADFKKTRLTISDIPSAIAYLKSINLDVKEV